MHLVTIVRSWKGVVDLLDPAVLICRYGGLQNSLSGSPGL